MKRFRKERRLTQAQIAEAVGVEQPTYQRWEAGKRAPGIDELEMVANAFGITVAELVAVEDTVALGPRLFVKGEVAAGVWGEAWQWEPDDWQAFTGSADVSVPMEHRFGLRVVGDSMDQLFPSGTILECVSFLTKPKIESGKKVVVLRCRDTGDCEATVKEYYADKAGKEWLIPRSNNPAFQTPIEIGNEEAGIVETRIVAVVVRAIIDV